MNNDLKRLYRTIRKHFRVTVRDDNLPVGSATGTRNTLIDCWRDAGYTVGAEIGVHRGHYSARILRTIPDCRLFCIDPWHAYDYSRISEENQVKFYDNAMRNLGQYITEGRATILRMESMEALKQFGDGELDFVYIDGNHHFDWCCPDIIYWSHKLKSGGMIGVHDYQAMRRSGVMEAVNAYTHAHHIDPWFVTREELPTAFWVKE